MAIMVFDKVKEVLSEQFEADANSITRDTNILDDLGADSLDLVELIMTLEEEYGIVVTDEEIYSCKTAGEIADYIEKLI